MKDKYLRETRMVDFSNPAIQKLIQNMKWKEMGEFEMHIPQELRIRSRGTERHSASN